MTYTPNYSKPSWDEYMNLLHWEARLAQEIEIHSRRRNWNEVAVLKRENKKLQSAANASKRRCNTEKPAQSQYNTFPSTYTRTGLAPVVKGGNVALTPSPGHQCSRL